MTLPFLYVPGSIGMHPNIEELLTHVDNTETFLQSNAERIVECANSQGELLKQVFDDMNREACKW